MAPIDGENVTRENAPKFLESDVFKDLTKAELMILAEVKDEILVTKESLLNKPKMLDTDKENMQKAITYLEKNNMDTEENLKKLDAINYGPNYIEIGSVKFSREKLIPQVEFDKEPNQYDVFKSDKEGVFKTMYNGKEEYHLSTGEYRVECLKQGKRVILNEHIREALQALPGEYSDNERYKGANILGNILNLSMSGYVGSDGILGGRGECGTLCSTPSFYAGDNRTFVFDEDKGEFYKGYNSDNARPCLYVVE